MKTEIYAVMNPYFLADIFIFSKRKLGKNKATTVYVKINCYEKIEEIGTDIEKRMHGRTLEDIIESKLCKKATESQKRLLNSIGNEFFVTIANMYKCIDRTQKELQILKKSIRGK